MRKLILDIFRKIKGEKNFINGSLFAFFSFFNQGVSFLLLIILAQYITPEKYGLLSLFNTILMFLGYIIALSSHGYESITFFKKNINEYKKDFSAILFISLIMATVLSLLSLFVGDILHDWIGLNGGYLRLAVTISFFSFIITMILDYLRINESLHKYGIISCGYAILNFVLSIYFVSYDGLDWKGRVWAHLYSACFMGLISLYFLYRYKLLTTSFDSGNIKKAIKWGVPLIPHLSAIWIKQGGDRFIINSNYGLDDVGMFSFSLNLLSIIVMVGVAFNSANSVSIYHLLSNKSMLKADIVRCLKKESKKISIIYMFFTIIIVFCVATFVPRFLPTYSNAVSCFLILAVAGFFNCLYFLFCNYLFYYNSNRYIMKTTFFTAVFHLLLSFVFTRYSLYITAFIYVLTHAIVLWFVYKKSKELINNNL